MHGYLQFDQLVGTQEIRRSPVWFPFVVEAEEVTTDLALRVLESTEDTLVRLGMSDGYCLAVVAFNSTPPQEFSVAELALYEYPFLQV
jgi:hypothetical protein